MIDSKYYRKKKCKRNNSGIISKFLISIIVLLSSLIICNYKSEYREYYRDKLLNNNISFYQFKKVLNKLGKDKSKDEVLVSNTFKQIEKVGDRTKIYYDMDQINYLKPGIIVFIGDKEDLGKTVIVQGNDGVDIWYSNLDTVNNSLYDYVNSNNSIGTAIKGELVVSIYKDGKYLSYEEYMAY